MFTLEKRNILKFAYTPYKCLSEHFEIYLLFLLNKGKLITYTVRMFNMHKSWRIMSICLCFFTDYTYFHAFRLMVQYVPTFSTYKGKLCYEKKRILLIWTRKFHIRVSVFHFYILFFVVTLSEVKKHKKVVTSYSTLTFITSWHAIVSCRIVLTVIIE